MQQLHHHQRRTFFCFTTNAMFNFLSLPYISSIITSIPYQERTVKERFSLLCDIVQQEANLINQTIILNKNVLNCFIMSRYNDNLIGLTNEVRSSIARASLTSKSGHIELSFDDLSDNVLKNIENINNHLDEINKIYEYLGITTFTLNPNCLNSFVEHLKNNLVYIDHRTLIDNTVIMYDKTIADHVNDDIRNALNTPLTTLNTSFIRDNYELLTPIFETSNIIKNDQLMYGYLLHCEKMVQTIISNRYQSIPIGKITLNKNYSSIISKVMSMLTSTYSISIPITEQYYLSEYLSISDSIVLNQHIPLLFILSNSTLIKNYSLFIDSLKTDIQPIYIECNVYNFAKQKNNLQKILNNFVHCKGILVLSDEPLYDEIESFLNQFNHRFVFISTISVQTLPQIIKLLQNEQVLLDDFKQFSKISSTLSISNDNESFNIIDFIKNEILNNSLTFLNPDKIILLAKEAFEAILLDYSMAYDEILAIKFIVHLAFAVERVIRNQPINYKKINEFLKQHSTLYHMIDKHCTNIENQFGIQFPVSEIIYISQIFLTKMEDDEYNKI